MPAGRPTKYNKAILEKANDYLETWREDGRVIPSHIGLAKRLEIRSSTLYDWGTHEDKEEFSDILQAVMDLQQEELINNGLTGEFNSAIAKLVLGKHGYSDRQETDLKANVSVKEIEHTIIDPILDT